jgi:hypothetical protein
METKEAVYSSRDIKTAIDKKTEIHKIVCNSKDTSFMAATR